MEMTHLNRYVTEDLSDPWSAVQDNGPEGKAFVFQGNPCLPIDIGRFCLYFFYVEVFLEVWRSDNTQTRASAEEGNVCYDHNRLWNAGMLFYRYALDTFPNPVFTLLVLRQEMIDRLSFVYVFLPDSFFSLLIS
jgi:hypothetical protein